MKHYHNGFFTQCGKDTRRVDTTEAKVAVTCARCRRGLGLKALPKPLPKMCDHCLGRVATTRLTATDLDGVVLDSQTTCKPCATKAGFEVGK